MISEASEMLTDFDPVAYINEPRWRSSRLGLERIVELMDCLGNPQEKLRFVHVAGTNGKGSTCAFASTILQRAGFKTGLFTSPYILEFSDRIRVDGKNISPCDLLQATLVVREQAEQMADHPTEFELMTAVALVHFQRVACDVVVMEVGLGGRFDSTNVIPTPEVCAIAPIALDHTDLLGDTLEMIAGEKAGIIKRGCKVVSAHQEREAACVIMRECEEKNASLTCVDPNRLDGVPWDFSYKERHGLRIGLLGSYQTQNAALAIEIIDALSQRGYQVSEEALRCGLAETTWPARFQRVADDPAFIVDGGHNAQGANALAESLVLNFPGEKAVFLMGVLADKDFSSMIASLVPLAKAFVCVTPPNPRALDAHDLARRLRQSCAGIVDVAVADGFSQGVALARELAGHDGIVCSCGSLYSVASVMDAL